KAKKRKEKAQANLVRFDKLGTRHKKTRTAVGGLTKKLKTKKLSLADAEADPALAKEIKNIRSEGGEFFLQQAEYAAADTALSTPGLSEAERRRLTARKTAAEGKLRKIKDDAAEAVEEMTKLLDGGNSRNGLKFKYYNKRLKSLGGEIEAEAFEAERERKVLAKEVGLPDASPMVNGLVPLDTNPDIPTGEVVAQGDDPVCGIAASTTAAGSRGCRKGFAMVMDEFTDAELKVLRKGTSGEQVVDLISDKLGWNSKAVKLDMTDPKRAVGELADAFEDRSRGPFVIGIQSRRLQKFADATAPEAQLQLPEGIGPALTQAGLQAIGANSYVHWVTVDGVYKMDGGGGTSEKHFLIRDSQSGTAYFYGTEDFADVFDGNMVEITSGQRTQ
ncbi:MAG: hypothetical protein AAFY31_13950, partial [Pseudomonadota bacterium]